MRLPVGKPVDAVVIRGGAEKTLTVTAADRESVEARIVEVPDLGITASDLTSWSAKELRRTDRAGVRVRGIRPGGAADEAKPSLRDDDVIVAVNGTSVKDVAGFSAALEQMTRGRTEPLPVLVGFDRRCRADGDRRRNRPSRHSGSGARGEKGVGPGGRCRH